MTQNELITRLRRSMRAQVNDLEDDDYTDAIDDAEQELGWTLPQTSAFRLKWLRLRSIRHLLYFLQSGSARKFRFEGAHLHHRFKHYSDMLKTMDEQFETAVEEESHLFEGVDAYKLFGTKIDAGFSSNKAGEDTTYDADNSVIFEPTENG